MESPLTPLDRFKQEIAKETGATGERWDIDLRPIVLEFFSEQSVVSLAETADGLISGFKLISVTFPIVEGVKTARMRVERVEARIAEANVGISIATAVTAIVTVLGGSFIVWKISKVIETAPGTAALGFGAVIAIVVGAVIFGGGLKRS